MNFAPSWLRSLLNHKLFLRLFRDKLHFQCTHLKRCDSEINERMYHKNHYGDKIFSLLSFVMDFGHLSTTDCCQLNADFYWQFCVRSFDQNEYFQILLNQVIGKLYSLVTHNQSSFELRYSSPDYKLQGNHDALFN